MKQMGQLYRVPHQAQHATVGGFVSSGHDNDDYLAGFINYVDEDEIEICLFKPQVLPDNVIRVVKESLTMDEVAALLDIHTSKDPALHAAWVEVVNGPTYDEPEESIH